jgi:hypothetical protein
MGNADVLQAAAPPYVFRHGRVKHAQTVPENIAFAVLRLNLFDSRGLVECKRVARVSFRWLMENAER